MNTLLTLADILAKPDPGPVNWRMEGILPARDRLLVTAEEGMGKSTMLRQAALSVSLGEMFEPSAQRNRSALCSSTPRCPNASW